MRFLMKLNKEDTKHVLVASDPDLVKFGTTQKVTTLLDQAGIGYTLFTDIQPNPTIENSSK